MNILSTKLSNYALKESKKGQHREGIILQGEVPASTDGGVFSAKVNVGTVGAIVTMRMAGTFTTLDLISGHVIDDGVCHLRAQLVDTDGNLNLYNDFVPLNVLLSPGRRKDTRAENNVLAVADVADTAGPAFGLYEGQEFTHPFTVNSDILINLKNDALYANSFEIYFDVIRVTRK
ncbi:MAG: hypothetical protein WBM07_17155 [Chitinivibrionales bacterium]